MNFQTLEEDVQKFQKKMVDDLLAEIPQAKPVNNKPWDRCFQVIENSVFLFFDLYEDKTGIPTTDCIKRDARDLVDN